MPTSLEYAVVFERAQGPRLAAAERLLLGWPDLFAGQLHEIDVGLRSDPQTLIAVARFEPFAPLSDVEARFGFWTEQAGGLWLSLGELATRERANLLSRLEASAHRALSVSPGELPRRLSTLLSALGIERDERRGTQRVRAELPLVLGTTGETVTYDLSTRGLFVRSRRPPPIGDRLQLALTIPGHPDAFHAEGRVAHHHSGDARRPEGFGLALLAPTHSLLDALATLVASGGRPNLTPRQTASLTPRPRIRLAVALHPSDPDAPRLENLSLGGAFVRTRSPLSIGAKVALDAALPIGPLVLEGVVVRSEPHGMAVRFQLDEDTRASLVTVLLGNSPRGGTNTPPPIERPPPTVWVRFATPAEVRAERMGLLQGALFIGGSLNAKLHDPLEIRLELAGGHRYIIPGRVVSVEAGGSSVELILDDTTRTGIANAVADAEDLSRTPPPSRAAEVAPFLDAPTPMPQVTQPERPRVGNYELLSLLGRGGMAEVFYGRALAGPHAGQYVAIKRLLPHLATDPVAVELFTGEADLSRLLMHPHIVQTLDVGTYPGGYFLVMEHVDGRDLGQVLRRCRKRKLQLPFDFAIYLARALFEALAYAHTAKGRSGRDLEVVHCDVSPSNVFISRNGEVKLGDFGVARIRGLAADGPLAGKPAYLSPEAMEGDVSPAGDVWAAAVCLYELLTLQRPFPGKKALEIAAAVRAGQYIPIREVRPEVPDVLSALLDMSFTADPSLRLTSAADFSTALEPLYDERVGNPLAIAALVRGLFGGSDAGGDANSDEAA